MGNHTGNLKKIWACPGVEPGTSHTLSENHATRPTSHRYLVKKFAAIIFPSQLIQQCTFRCSVLDGFIDRQNYKCSHLRSAEIGRLVGLVA